MDKDRKIRRYRQKDYTQVVEFPVEIIGRDGLVRRYSFEESIRLYQRRIASADLRYHDREVIQAEKQHCQSRIGQLRRSFFAHYGWPEIQMVDEGANSPHSLSAEVAAFLKRCLDSVEPQPQEFSFSQIDMKEHYRVYFIQPPPDEMRADQVTRGHFLLYVFRFDTTGGCPRREAFFDLIKLMDGIKTPVLGSIERLVAFFHTHDCGLVLTGNGHIASNMQGKKEIDDLELSWAEEARPADPVDIAMRMLGRGRLEKALELFVQGYTQHHFRRVAYLGAAVVADQLGEDLEAETATVMGCRYFPGDPAFVYHRAVNLVRHGMFGEARTTLEQITCWPKGEGAVQLVFGLTWLADGQLAKGQRCLKNAQAGNFKLDPHLNRALRWCQSQIWARNLLTAGAVIGAGMSALACVMYGNLLWLSGCLLFAFGVGAIRRSWSRQLHRQLTGAANERLPLSSTSLLMAIRNKQDVQ